MLNMLKHRHFISYFSTSLIYLFMISLFFYAQNHYLVSTKKIEDKTMQLCLCSFQPEVVTSVEQVEQEEVEEEKEIEKPIVEEEPIVEEKPVVEPEIMKEPTPEKRLKSKKSLFLNL